MIIASPSLLNIFFRLNRKEQACFCAGLPCFVTGLAHLKNIERFLKLLPRFTANAALLQAAQPKGHGRRALPPRAFHLAGLSFKIAALKGGQ